MASNPPQKPARMAFDFNAPSGSVRREAAPDQGPAMAARPAGIPAPRSAIQQPIPDRPKRAAMPAPAVAPGSGAPIPAQSAPRFDFGGSFMSPAERAAKMAQEMAPDKISGILTDVRIYNDWGVAKVIRPNGSRVSVKGSALVGLDEGQRYQFEGKKSVHPKYGEQFDVVRANPDVESLDAIVSHLRRNFKGLGMQTALAVAHHHRDAGTLDAFKEALIHAPSSIDFSPFTDRVITLKDDDDSRLRRVRDSLSIRLGGLGVNQNAISNLALYLAGQAFSPEWVERFPDKDPVSRCHLILDEDPYKPVAHVEHYGFRIADLIGQQLKFDPRDPRRMAAVAAYALNEACQNGSHVWIGQDAFVDAVRRIDYRIDAMEAFEAALSRSEPVVRDESSGQPRYYTKDNYWAEMQLSHQLAMRMTHEVEPLYDGEPDELEEDIDAAVKRIEELKGKALVLDESQRNAIRGILTSRCSLHTLTAGPGCGKTTIVEVIMEVLTQRRNDLNPIFCAPTGKAAKELNKRVSRWGNAKTIHSTLEYQGYWNRNADNPLDSSLVTADETSMKDTPLGYRFFDAVPANAHVIMLGDPQQLAPVGVGNVLKAVLELEGLDHHRLTTTHRNDGDLLEVINAVGRGYCDAISSESVKFAGHLPEPTAENISHFAAQVKEAAQQYGGLHRVAVICPLRKGSVSEPGWNVTHLNARLRDAINPDNEAKTKRIVGTTFQLDDRVIVTENMWIAPNYRALNQAKERGEADAYGQRNENGEVYVVNGDTGQIVGVQFDPEANHKKLLHLLIRLDDDRVVEFPAAALESLALGYALTVHAAQGSEYGKTFAVVTDGHEAFMYRSMMFTQFSRAQKELEVLGEPAVLSKVAARPAPKRNCSLVQRVIAEVSEVMGQKMHEADASTDRARHVA